MANGLTIEKLREAQKLLNANEVPTDDRGFYFNGIYVTRESSQEIRDEVAKLLDIKINEGENMSEVDFGIALSLLKRGMRVQREGWNGKGMYLELQEPGELSKMTLPYIYILTADAQLVPWLASQTDLLAEDWKLVK